VVTPAEALARAIARLPEIMPGLEGSTRARQCRQSKLNPPKFVIIRNILAMAALIVRQAA
jgi:hypothetical protein